MDMTTTAAAKKTKKENDNPHPDTGHDEDYKSVIISCEDGYEAQKLASLIMSTDPDTGQAQTFIKSVVNIIKNEIVILLADGSSHSILLKDAREADTFADFVQSITENRHRLVMASTQGKDDCSVAIAKRLGKDKHVKSHNAHHGNKR